MNKQFFPVVLVLIMFQIVSCTAIDAAAASPKPTDVPGEALALVLSPEENAYFISCYRKMYLGNIGFLGFELEMYISRIIETMSYNSCTVLVGKDFGKGCYDAVWNDYYWAILADKHSNEEVLLLFPALKSHLWKDCTAQVIAAAAPSAL